MQRFSLRQKADSVETAASEITEVWTSVRTRQCLRCPLWVLHISFSYFPFPLSLSFLFFFFFFKCEIKNMRTGMIMTSFVHVQNHRKHDIKAGAAPSGSQEVKGTFWGKSMDLLCRRMKLGSFSIEPLPSEAWQCVRSLRATADPDRTQFLLACGGWAVPAVQMVWNTALLSLLPGLTNTKPLPSAFV